MAETQEVGEIVTVTPSVVATLAKAELDQSITTAKAYPRSVERFTRRIEQLACLNETVAGECIYALPRRDSDTGQQKNIVGPSARFAEILLSQWGNCIAGATIVDDAGDYVTARGVFHDLENNVKVYRETRRRITGRNGRRFSPDMIAVTANAAASIAQRNATYAGIPQALWAETFEKVLALVRGRAETFAARRDKALEVLGAMGVPLERVLAKLERAGLADMTIDDIVLLRGLVKAVHEGEVGVDEAFPPVAVAEEPKPEKGVKGLVDRVQKAKADAQPKPDHDAPRPGCTHPGCTREGEHKVAGKYVCAEHVPAGRM